MSMTPPMKVLIATVLLFVVAVGFYLLDWQKKLADRTSAEQQAAARQQEYEGLTSEVSRLESLVQENERLRAQVSSSLHAGDVGGDFIPDFLDKLETLVRAVAAEKDDRFEIVTITPGTLSETSKDAKRDDVLDRLPKRKFQIQLKGRYETLVAFLQRLGALALDRLVTVDRLSLGIAEGSHPHPSLTITLPLTAYLKGASKP